MSEPMLALHGYFPAGTCTVQYVRASSVDAVAIVDPDPQDPPDHLGVLVVFNDGASIQVPVPTELAVDTVERIVADINIR